MMHTACDCALHGLGKAEVAAWLRWGILRASEISWGTVVLSTGTSNTTRFAAAPCRLQVLPASGWWQCMSRLQSVQKILHALAVETSSAVARCRECDASLRIFPLAQLKPEAGGPVLPKSSQSGELELLMSSAAMRTQVLWSS